MKKSMGLWVGMMMIGVLGLAPIEAQAQDAPCSEVVAQMQRVERMFEDAEEKLRNCSVPEAKALVESAKRNWMSAQSEVQRGRCVRAAVRVEAAMKLVTRAIETCQQGDRHREQLGQTIRRTEEMLRHVQDTVVTNDSDQCQQFLRAAIKEQKRAMELFHTDRLRLALRLTLRARELGERALRCANQEVGAQDVNTMKLLERTDHFLAEVEDAVDNKGGRTLLDEAKRLQHEARRQALRRKFELAQRLTEQSRVLAAKSLSKLESDLNTRDVAQMIAGTEDLLQKLDENAPNAAPNATSLLKKAHRLLDDAKSSLQKGKPREAFAKVRASSAAALEVARLLGVHGGH